MKYWAEWNGFADADRPIAERVLEIFADNGNEECVNPWEADCVFNFTSIQKPRVFHRRSRAVMVISVVCTDSSTEKLQSVCYRTLIRTLSNQVMCIVRNTSAHSARNSVDSSEVYFTTPEAGFYHLPFHGQDIYRCISPVANAHFVIDNKVSYDLPRSHWKSSAIIEQIRYFGVELDRLGVLPAPFPIEKLLSPTLLKRVYRLYGMTGLSYGNLSAREMIPKLGQKSFWMTGRGVNKAHLNGPGEDIHCVKGYDRTTDTILLSAPPGRNPKARVSVDAVEHAMIYETFPRVGAIVHVHAWMDDAVRTRQNSPCGSRELAQQVVDALHSVDDPSCAVIGLINHGLTITGKSLADIFRRIDGRLQKQVPMRLVSGYTPPSSLRRKSQEVFA